MYGLGGTEILIILLVAIVVFGGPAVIGFWLGYQAGKKSGDSGEADGAVLPSADSDAEETASHE